MKNTIHIVKTVAGLSADEIATVLKHWEVSACEKMNAVEFRELFVGSEFHLLEDDTGKLLAAARINFNFYVKKNGRAHHFPELVGLVAMQKNEGFGTVLVGFIKNNLTKRGIEAIGFCEVPLRHFYEKCGLEIFYGKAKFLREPDGNGWAIPTDDDLLNLSLSSGSVGLFESLSDANLGYLIL